MTELSASALMIAGLALALSGLRRLHRADSWPGWAFVYLFAFRRVVVGACLFGAGVGLAQGITWLLAVSVCVGIGELLESSYYISVMRWGQRRGTLSG
jgi:hypothetical protein